MSDGNASAHGAHRAGGSWRGVLVVVAWLLAATLVQLLRQRGAPAVDTIWAEDGTIWTAEAWAEGPIGAFPDTYAGYFHALPRVLGGLISLLPLQSTAVVLAVVSAIVVAALALFVFVQSGELFESWWARAALGVLVVVPPPGAWETTANITNLQWNLLYPCFWALLVPPRTRPRTVAATAIGATAALSAPISIVLAPLALWALARWPERRGRWVGGVFLFAAAIQVAVVLAQGVPPSHDTHLADLAPLYGLRVGAGLALGDPGLIRLWPDIGWGLALIGGVVVAALVLGAFADRGRRVPLAIALAASAAMFAAPVYLRGTSLLTPERDLVPNGSKWVLAPLLLLATVAVALAERPPGGWAWVRLPVRALALAGLAFSVVTSFSAHTARSEGPRWSRTVDRAAGVCLRRAPATVQVSVTPRPFFAILPCDRLVGGADASPDGRPLSP